MLDSFQESDFVKPFKWILKVDTKRIYEFIAEEHPQIITLILLHVPSIKAMELLAMMPKEKRNNVVQRIATTRQLEHDVVREIERVLERKLFDSTPAKRGSAEFQDEIVSMLDEEQLASYEAYLEEKGGDSYTGRN